MLRDQNQTSVGVSKRLVVNVSAPKSRREFSRRASLCLRMHYGNACNVRTVSCGLERKQCRKGQKPLRVCVMFVAKVQHSSFENSPCLAIVSAPQSLPGWRVTQGFWMWTILSKSNTKACRTHLDPTRLIYHMALLSASLAHHRASESVNQPRPRRNKGLTLVQTFLTPLRMPKPQISSLLPGQ